MSPEKPTSKPYSRRIDAVTARSFAYEVHTSDAPVLFRTHKNRAEANSRCWEWNHKRPVFQGLGIEFFVRTVTTSSGKTTYGIYGKKAEDAHNSILHTDQGTFLKLTPLATKED